jgi:RNA polymerase sigma-70 factor (ECF subfamily)
MAVIGLKTMAETTDFVGAGDAETSALRGDATAWGALVRRHGRRVTLALIADGVPPAQARDLAQDAWLRLMEQARAGGLTYLKLPGLAVRQARFLARSSERRARAEVLPGPAEAASPESGYMARERLERARAIVERLGGSARAVFAMLYGEPELPLPEVAARLGLSRQRVRQIVCEVRAVLRRELTP